MTEKLTPHFLTILKINKIIELDQLRNSDTKKISNENPLKLEEMLDQHSKSLPMSKIMMNFIETFSDNELIDLQFLMDLGRNEQVNEYIDYPNNIKTDGKIDRNNIIDYLVNKPVEKYLSNSLKFFN